VKNQNIKFAVKEEIEIFAPENFESKSQNRSIYSKYWKIVNDSK